MSLKRRNEDAGENFESEDDSDLDFHEDYFDDLKDFCHIKNLNGQLDEESKPPLNKVTKLDSVANGMTETKVLRLLQEPSVWRQSDKSNQARQNTSIQIDFAKVENLENRPVSISIEKIVHKSTINSIQDDSFSDDCTLTDINSSFNNFKCSRLHSLPSRKIKTKQAESYDSSKPSWFDLLPDEVILRILSFLPKYSLIKFGQTCKNFLRLATDETLWKRIDLGGRILPGGAIGQVFSRGVNVLRLTRSTLNTPLYTNQYGSTFNALSSCKLQYLDLSMAILNVETLEQLLEPCCRLKKLALENCEVSEKACLYISENSSLEVLHLGMSTGLKHNGLIAILGCCTNLTELNLAWSGLTESTFDVISDRFHPNLVKLNLSGFRQSLLTRHIVDIVKCCSNLKELDISDCTSLTVEAFDLIFDNLSLLEIFSASRCYKIRFSRFTEVEHKSLRYLNVFGLFERVEERDALSTRMPNVDINKHMFSSIARPTFGIRRSSIWNIRVREA